MTGKCSGVFSSMRSLGKPSKGRDPFLTLEEFRCDSCDSDNVSAAISASKEIPGLLFSSTSGVGKVFSMWGLKSGALKR